MDNIIKALFIVLFSVSGFVMNMDLSTHSRTAKYLKEDIEIAVHDASLFLDQQKLANGQFAFDRLRAEEEFKKSFYENTGLQHGVDYKLLEFKVFDQSNSTFPVHYRASSVDFDDIFTAPTIVALIELEVSKYFSNNSKEPVRKIASYTYNVKLDRLGQPTIEIVEEIIANENGLYWIVPFTNNITSPFDPYRVHPITNEVKAHNGIDISATNILNKPVVSARDGKVIFAGSLGSYGNLVVIDHGNGFETRYAHLNSINVTNNQSVVGGQVIGLIGSTGASTGPHLHFEIRIDGVPIDPMILY